MWLLWKRHSEGSVISRDKYRKYTAGQIFLSPLNHVSRIRLVWNQNLSDSFAQARFQPRRIQQDIFVKIRQQLIKNISLWRYHTKMKPKSQSDVTRKQWCAHRPDQSLKMSLLWHQLKSRFGTHAPDALNFYTDNEYTWMILHFKARGLLFKKQG